MQARLDRQQLLPGQAASSGLAKPVRSLTSHRVTSFSRGVGGKGLGPLPLSRFGKPFSQDQPDTSSRDVSCDAHCAIPWEIAEKSLVDPAGKDACGVSTWSP